MLEITLPNDIYFNCGVSSDYKYLIADTNDSSNWKTVKIPLPEGKWSIYSNPMGNKITLQNNE